MENLILHNTVYNLVNMNEIGCLKLTLHGTLNSRNT